MKNKKSVNKFKPVEKKTLPPWMTKHPADNKDKKVKNFKS